MKAIIITLLSGLSFLVGYLITKFVKNDKKLVIFSVGFSFSIILGLVFFDLLPECLELMNSKFALVGFAISGILILKVLDMFVPDHSHNSEHNHHIEHIGLISALALILHNIIYFGKIYKNNKNKFKLLMLKRYICSFIKFINCISHNFIFPISPINKIRTNFRIWFKISNNLIMWI